MSTPSCSDLRVCVVLSYLDRKDIKQTIVVDGVDDVVGVEASVERLGEGGWIARLLGHDDLFDPWIIVR